MLHHILPTRLSRGAVLISAILLSVSASVAHAQGGRFATRLLFGASSPTGALEDTYRPGGTVGLQGSWDINSNFAATVTTAWTNAPTQLNGSLPHGALAWTYDAGMEFRTPRIAANRDSWRLQPFVGAGIGSRSYMLSTRNESTTGLAGFGAIGADVNRRDGRLGLRLEIRGYQTSFTDVEKTRPRTNGSELTTLVGFTWRG